MLEIIKEIPDYKVLHLLDGRDIPEAIRLVNKKKANGINLNFIRNTPDTIDDLKRCSNLKCLLIHPFARYDYNVIHEISSLESLSIYAADKKEIDCSKLPNLTKLAIQWRPKAASLFACTQLEELFIGGYSETDLAKFHRLDTLRYLRINLGSVQKLSGIEAMSNLEELLLMQNTKLESLAGIEKLPRLSDLYISNCKRIRDIDTIRKCKYLTRVHIDGTTPKLS